MKQVRLFFVWVAYLASIGFGFREAVYINIDETPIPHHFGGRKGLKKQRRGAHEDNKMIDKATTRDIRSQSTLMAAMANDVDVQKNLPQVLMPNTTGRKKKWLAASLKAAAVRNIKVFRDTCGWVTIEALAKYLKVLGKAVKDMGKEKVVLVMDCHSTHYSLLTLRLLRRMGWQVLLVPAKLTWLLQPLDAYFFVLLKRNLHFDSTYDRISSKDGQQTFESWADTCFETISNTLATLDSKWMFNKCGYNIPSHGISERVLQHLQGEDFGVHRPLTADELSVYTGKKKERVKLIHKHLFRAQVPVEFQTRPIVVRIPKHRLRSKRTLDDME